MKLRHLPLIAAAGLFSTITLAAGYTGPGSDAAKPAAAAQVTTVKQAQSAADDTPAVLEGVITKRLHGEHYEFKDATGTIQVEIDHDDWPAGASVSESTKVRLTGEVDHHNRKATDIDVDRVEILQ
ncbi:NirD/YgiW/YdeI family stress tolerance protein [Pseudomonas sp. ZM23]|uniref:NirD/YgiW/YdeI family stress tolerance protein n=1 Tax=Pseudomonas triclosanedens TaxID=2961893 RepID=A0ABY6ZZR8_9PSED|nr:NirD/YgiW/YdeI family stress tolerance protein [Pseudomonas triclosanedens]MCP8466824.1 NirD/YgiW/YdeI family stress tolerance protein [Pseudomonas triclosanedens]MCP8470048.1 NirD/YgiW/YdeI family stress tolerance protein [Pseudomonas triclosanedens]MCP8477958.1 NirD/YgiW/YdeI family stress tolerance protein [Pseudomonas triclosanedens]WAI49374.1 NirD/YgiW/YdeI family stress tolerance protein [Pseudomonas triclosanedens]